MPSTIRETARAFALARGPRRVRVDMGGSIVEVPEPFPSPTDWRDVWIYFLLVDRFDNPSAPPRTDPWDGEHGSFQGGTLDGVRRRLGYLKDLGAGAIWLSPVLKNPQFDQGTYHGYGVQDFLTVDPRFTSDPDRARADPSFGDLELRTLVREAHARGIYVILDVVLNHTGDVFEYEGIGSVAPFRDDPYPIRWRDADGAGRADWTQAPADPPADAAVWPAELRRNAAFRRRGNAFTRPFDLGEAAGDFFSLKELVTAAEDEEGKFSVRDTLITAAQYLIAAFDVDGFRIDTLKYIEPDFARVFGNAVREFALSIGKENVFTFGEVYDSEAKIARFIGRNAGEQGDLVGVDAALDFPLFFTLPAVAKGMAPPLEIARLYEDRKRIQRDVVTSHWEAGRFFVTFLDNHDQHARFRHQDPLDPARFDHQVTLALGCLFGVQGIPCLYYGTEQGLAGSGSRPEAVREALWGKPDGFDLSYSVARAIRNLTTVREGNPALRFGRQYVRPISGDGIHFGVSPFPGGVLAFSRILNDREVLVAANTNTATGWAGEVLVDRWLNAAGRQLDVVFTNQPGGAVRPAPVLAHQAGSVEVAGSDGASTGPIHSVPVTLGPMEIQFLA